MNEENRNLEKWLWTQDDYDQMGWHDATIRAIAFLPEADEIALDIDYIFEWIDPAKGETYFNFRVSPATLVFENINDVIINLELFDDVQLQNISRGDSRKPRNAEFIGHDREWNWTFDANVGDITLWSIGYKQFIRQAPVLTHNQILSLDERGGFSFARGTIH